MFFFSIYNIYLKKNVSLTFYSKFKYIWRSKFHVTLKLDSASFFGHSLGCKRPSTVAGPLPTPPHVRERDGRLRPSALSVPLHLCESQVRLNANKLAELRSKRCALHVFFTENLGNFDRRVSDMCV